MIKKIRIYIAFAAFVAPLVLAAQQTDYETIILPVDVKARDFSEYLVQLAWMNNPAGAIVQDEVKNAQLEAKNTKKEWMRDVQATFNLNEANLRSPDSASNVFFPRYNFGISLNLFNILSQKTKNEIGKRDIRIAEHEVNQAKLRLRAETLKRYTQYRQAREIFKTRALVEQEMYSNYILIQQLFKTDEKTYDEYVTASSTYFKAQEDRIRAEGEVQVYRFGLEEIIGLKWEQVQHPGKEE